MGLIARVSWDTLLWRNGDLGVVGAGGGGVGGSGANGVIRSSAVYGMMDKKRILRL